MKNMHQDNVLFSPQEKHHSPTQDFVKEPLAPTIFHEQWWLSIATGDTYKLVEVRENGEVVGWLSG